MARPNSIVHRSVIFFLVLTNLILFGACTKNDSTRINAEAANLLITGDLPSPSMVKGLGPREALALANKWKTTETSVTSYVDTQKINFEFQNGGKASVPLPNAKMVVAIAPYINGTHPCEVHYMSGCQGELVNMPIKVLGKTADGLVVVDKIVNTLDNGFFELWLARDLEIELVIEYEDRRASQVITTYKSSKTCITTMRL